MRLKKIVGRPILTYPKLKVMKNSRKNRPLTMTQLAAVAAPFHHARKVIQRDCKIDELKQRFLSDSISYSRRILVVYLNTQICNISV